MTESRQQLARDFLRRVARDINKARCDLWDAEEKRIRYVKDARSHGLTDAQIGEALGVTEQQAADLAEQIV